MDGHTTDGRTMVWVWVGGGGGGGGGCKMQKDYIPPLLCHGQITASKIDEICPLAFSNINAYASLVKIH